jgi:hypothetical protein
MDCRFSIGDCRLLRSVEGHLIPAELVLRGSGGAGIQLVGTWAPALRQAQGRLCAGVTNPMTSIFAAGPPGHEHFA